LSLAGVDLHFFDGWGVMQQRSAGIILAGGRSSRMGIDKALLEIDGETLLARSTRAVSAVVNEVLIVGRTELPPQIVGTPAIEDMYPGAGPLGGIASGLARVGAKRALVVACDLPFPQVDLLRLLLELAPGYDAVVPAPRSGRAGAGARPYGDGMSRVETAQSRAQPTCAVYARSCLPVMQSRLAHRQYRLRDLLGDLHVRWVEDEEIRIVDPDYRSFLNANTPAEWNELSRRYSSRRKDSG
jgi:molybdenum cofactor guanylyltransferase